MKKLIFIALFAFAITARAQITMEHDYDSASTIYHGSPRVADQLMIINFEVSGERYVNINREGKYISIYDMNHSLVKKINCSSFPLQYGTYMGEVLYLSDQLFNMDSKIEFLYCFTDQTTNPNTYYTGIYNEDGEMLFSESAYAMININVLQQQYPIYNTREGAKIILSYPNGHAKVFSLPGRLNTAIAEANNNLIATQTQSSMVSNAYPNPAQSATRIDYTFPNGVNEGEIVFYNLQGNEVKRFKVDRTFDSLLISTSDLAAGTYYYQLQTAVQSSEGKKMVVIK
ncbi:MAG: T9SS type A sorting domain-containing protein [Bacteroidetes bacterium]|nr:T9SS type A sorting domain-containing protein [Bacteroidota bacterium]